jgi:preprotein translocase subunit SecA
MFGWFKKKKGVEREEDKIWMNEGAKQRGLAQELRARQEKGDIRLLIVHFEESFRRMEEMLRREQLAYEGYRTHPEAGRLRLGPAALGGPVRLILSETILAIPPIEGAPEALEGHISLLVGERYPIPTRDEQVEQVAAMLPQPARLCFHTSLDEPLLQRFMDDNTMSLIRRLGASENEPISSGLLGRSVRSAQQRIAKETTSDLRSDSAAHWFENNLPRSH